MTERGFELAIRSRLDTTNASVTDAAMATLARYLTLLARWNRRINLTAFDLDRPTGHAIDRLIVEPVVAAIEVRAADRDVVDVGSGGGSPALPLKIVLPRLRMTLLEARIRKSAFLREAVRELDLDGVRVETVRLGRRGHAELNGTANVVTMRAVRADAELLDGVGEVLEPHGRLFWFQADTKLDPFGLPPGWTDARARSGLPSFLKVLVRAE